MSEHTKDGCTVVVDLFSRKVVGWSMHRRITKDIVLNALLMAVWRRNPKQQVTMHSDREVSIPVTTGSLLKIEWAGGQHEQTRELP